MRYFTLKWSLLLLFSFAIFLNMSACSISMNLGDFESDTSLDNVMKTNKLIIGMEYDFYPMGTLNPDTGEASGFDVELATIVAERLGVKVEFVYVPWMDDILALQKSNADCIWNCFQKTPERKTLYALSIPYIKDRQVFMIKNDSKYKNLSQLSGKTIGVIDQSAGKFAMNNISNQQFRNSLPSIVDLVTYTQGIDLLDENAIDALLSDELVAKNYINNNPYNYKLLLDENNNVISISDMEVVVAFRRNDNKLKAEINQILSDLSKEGVISELSKKWFGDDVSFISSTSKSQSNLANW